MTPSRDGAMAAGGGGSGRSRSRGDARRESGRAEALRAWAAGGRCEVVVVVPRQAGSRSGGSAVNRRDEEREERERRGGCGRQGAVGARGAVGSGTGGGGAVACFGCFFKGEAAAEPAVAWVRWESAVGVFGLTCCLLGQEDATRAARPRSCGVRLAGWPAASRRAVRREDASPGAVDAGSCGRGNGWDGGVGYVANAHEIGVVQLIRLS